MQGYPLVQVGTSVYVFDLAYADDIKLVNNKYWEMQGLLESVNHHAIAVGMGINPSKTNVLSAFIPGERRQAVLLHGEPL